MGKSKKKQQENEVSTGKTIAIIFGTIIIVAIIFSVLSDNSYSNKDSFLNDLINDSKINIEQRYHCEEGSTFCGDACYSCIEGYYIGSDCECYPTEQTKKELEYEEADKVWREYVSILQNDGDKTKEIVNNYCSNVDYTEFPNCYNNLQPRLEAYATHIVNAQNFLSNTENIFSNKNSLLASLDEEAVFVTSISNWLASTTNDYNNWVATQQYEQEISQQREQAIYDTISLLSGFI